MKSIEVAGLTLCALGVGKRVGIVDVGIGNVASVASILRRAGVYSDIISTPRDVNDCERIILPGVGHFGAFLGALEATGLQIALNEHALVRKKPILGLCVGAQAFLESSEEAGNVNGLAWIKGTNLKVGAHESRFVPRTGWDALTSEPRVVSYKNLEGHFSETSRFYFTHSYKFAPIDTGVIVAASASSPSVPAIMCKENILGAQFHPEKSLSYGAQFLLKFLSWTPVVS